MEIRITFIKCKHTEVKEIAGANIYEAEHNADWHRRNRVCSDCFAEARSKKVQDAKDSAAHAGLVQISGSEKQVKWGLAIRQQKIEEAKKFVGSLRGEIITHEKIFAKSGSGYSKNRIVYLNDRLSDFDEKWQSTIAIAEASFWIDHRTSNSPGIAAAAVAYSDFEIIF